MNAWKVILATLVIFGAGVVTGALTVKQPWRGALTQSALPSSPKASQHPEVSPRGTNRVAFNPPGPLMGLRKDFLKNMERELHLTEEQREKIEKILNDGQAETHKLWETVAPGIKVCWSKVKNNIRAELNEEQKKQFEEFMKRGRKSDERRPPGDNASSKAPPHAPEQPANP
ncbi:MAG TPA: hypothetical protein PKA41_10095 [Verrucomicrobiota bacterium]|nr:hypothetical protein [Verrucomicrobiota bacterium]